MVAIEKGILICATIWAIITIIVLLTNKLLIYKNGITFIIFLICTFVLPTLICLNYESHTYKNYIYQFETEKEIIEYSILHRNLSGYERSELIKQATNANKILAGYKYDCQQWYGFDIPDEILYVEFISLEG